jgi:hypothetical protein
MNRQLAAILTATSIAFIGCAAEVATPPATPPPPDRTIAIATSSWKPGDGALQALRSGVLKTTPDGCPYLAPSDPRSPATDRTPLIWPAGFTARHAKDGKVEVLAPNGSVIVREGDYLSVGGGLLPSRSRPCTLAATNAFVIMEDLTR